MIQGDDSTTEDKVYRLPSETIDNKLPWIKESEKFSSQAEIIQRTWRQYKSKSRKKEENANAPSLLNETAIYLASEFISEIDLSEAESGNQSMSVSSPDSVQNLQDGEEMQSENGLEENERSPFSYANLDASSSEEQDEEAESDSESVLSFCSDVSDSVPKFSPKKSSSLCIFEENDLKNKNVLYTTTQESTVARKVEETDEQFAKRVRKFNYLTMAQEFAALKKNCPEALPFDAHKSQQNQLLNATSPMSVGSASENELITLKSLSNCNPQMADKEGKESNDMKYPENMFMLIDLPKADVPDILKMDGIMQPCYNIRTDKWNIPIITEDKNSEHKADQQLPVAINQFFPNIKDYDKPVNMMCKNKLSEDAEMEKSAKSYNNSEGVKLNTSPEEKKDMEKEKIKNPKSNLGEDYEENKIVPCNKAKSQPSSRPPPNNQLKFSDKPPANMIKKDKRDHPPANMKNHREHNSTTKRFSHTEDHPANWNTSHYSKSFNSWNKTVSRDYKHKEHRLSSPEILGGFDVYNIETAMPTIDWAAMEEHLAKAAQEEEMLRRQRRNDREEIRRRLAMGSDTDEYYGGEKMTRKPSLQTRLQSGMNLQICFMNETASDQESLNSDPETISADKPTIPIQPVTSCPSIITTPNTKMLDNKMHISTPMKHPSLLSSVNFKQNDENMDFVTRQAKLQAEARLALAQAKEMARMQMEVEKQRKKKSPIAEMVRLQPHSHWVGIAFPDGRRRASRQVLNEMNVAQLQVIVNDLHTQIENLNEELVRLLLERDDLHMEQDSMLVDIEDLTRYLDKDVCEKQKSKNKSGAKDEALKENQKKPQPLISTPKLKFRKKK